MAESSGSAHLRQFALKPAQGPAADRDSRHLRLKWQLNFLLLKFQSGRILNTVLCPRHDLHFGGVSLTLCFKLWKDIAWRLTVTYGDTGEMSNALGWVFHQEPTGFGDTFDLNFNNSKEKYGL